RGTPVAVSGEDGKLFLVLAAEAASEPAIRRLAQLSEGALAVTITLRRARVLGLNPRNARPVVLVSAGSGLSAALVQSLADPLGAPADISALSVLPTPDSAEALVTL